MMIRKTGLRRNAQWIINSILAHALPQRAWKIAFRRLVSPGHLFRLNDKKNGAIEEKRDQ